MTSCNMEELKACPFCGGDASEETAMTANVGGKPFRYIICTECSGQSDFHDWNTRTINSTPDSNAMREALEALERVTRLADNLASDVPITAAAREHIDRAYSGLAVLRTALLSSDPWRVE